MQCAKPMSIESKHNVYNNYVPCGKCYACLSNKRNIWTMRLLMELRVAESAYFVTLTYNQENVPTTLQYSRFKVQTLKKRHLQLFFKSLRTEITKNGPRSRRWLKQSPYTYRHSPRLRYFSVGEYGGVSNRPHYHVLMYNLPNHYIISDPIHNNQFSEFLTKIWGKGNVDIGKIEHGSIHYVTKYHLHPITLDWHDHEQREKPFSLMSRKPGLGLNYIDEHTKNYYARTNNPYATLKDGFKQPLGRYYKDKIYTEEQLKIVNKKANNYAIKEKKKEAENYGSYSDLITAQQINYESATRKIKLQLKKNNKL